MISYVYFKKPLRRGNPKAGACLWGSSTDGPRSGWIASTSPHAGIGHLSVCSFVSMIVCERSARFPWLAINCTLQQSRGSSSHSVILKAAGPGTWILGIGSKAVSRAYLSFSLQSKISRRLLRERATISLQLEITIHNGPAASPSTWQRDFVSHTEP